MGFAGDLDNARAERTPQMALRPDYRYPELLDDVVVKDVEMFRMEAMSDDTWWMCCYFANGESVTFHAVAKCRPRRLEISTTETPGEWIDIDQMRDGGGSGHSTARITSNTAQGAT